MRYVVFDIETQNSFSDVGKHEPSLLDISVVSAFDTEEQQMHTATIDDIDNIWPVFERADAIVGFNSNHFDIPILEKYYPGTLGDIKSIDILEDVKLSLGRRIKLDSIAEATLKVRKSGHGLQAISWWRSGEIDKVKQYCEDDVRITKDIFLYALNKGFLWYPDGGKRKKITLDTTHWREKDETAMTHSLGF